MAGKRITELNSMTGAQVDPVADVLAIVDVDGQETKKISIDEIALAIGSGAVNVSLNLNNNLLELTDSNNNTLTADLSSLDNSGLTLQDVTSNGAVSSVNFVDFENLSANSLLTRASSIYGNQGLNNNYRVTLTTNLNSYFDNNIFHNSLSLGTTAAPTVTLDIQGTDAVQLTSGTTAERPTTPAEGMIRYNSENGVFEGYDGAWKESVYYLNTGELQVIQPTNQGLLYLQAGSVRVVEFQSNNAGDGIFNFRDFSGLQRVKIASRGDSYFNGGKIGLGTITPTVTLDIQGTDAVQLTSGTTAQRPTGNAGQIRFNTDTSKFEGFDGTTWIDLN